MSADIAQAIAQEEVAGGSSALDGLTPREVEILGLTASGATVQATADALCLSPKTIHNTLSVIRSKLGARTDAHLVWIAVGAGLVSAPDGGQATG